MKLLEQFIDVASFLEDEVLKTKYQEFANKIESGRFLLPVIGQFSAGKSYFINNLLGGKYLPVQITETTAFLTYISYAEKLSAYVYGDDGNSVAIEISLLSELHENNLKQHSVQELLGLPKDFNIAYISIGVPNHILKKGIVLVDTPGLNTLNSKHEALTHDILNQADYFLYVIKSSLSQKDLELIAQVQKIGTEVVVIRTRIDAVNEEEESIDSLVDHERSLLEKLTGEVNYFPVSNTLKKEGCFVSLWKDMEDRLETIFAKELRTLLEHSFLLKLHNDKEFLLGQLNDRLQFLKQTSNLTIQEVKEQKGIVEKEIKRLQLEEKTSKKSFEICEKFSGEIAVLKSDLFRIGKSNFLKKLEAKGVNSVEQLASEVIEDIASQMTIFLSKKLDDISKRFENEYNERISEIDNLKIPTLDRDISFCIDDVEEYNSALLVGLERSFNDVSNNIEDCSNRLTKYQELKDELSGSVAKLESLTSNAEKDIAEHENSYETQYVIKEGKKVSGTLKTIGSIVDIASLFNPVSKVTSVSKVVKSVDLVKDGMTALGKISKTVSKSKHVASGVVKVGRGVKKGKDIFNQSANILNKSKEGLKQTSTVLKSKGMLGEAMKVLDLATAEYWFSKIGEKFDEPDKKVIDKDYEKAFEDMSRSLKENYAKQQSAYVDQKLRLEDITNSEREFKLKLDYDKKFQQNLVSKIEKERLSLQKKREQSINNQYRLQFEIMLQENMDLLVKKMEDAISETENKYRLYLDASFAEKLSKIQHSYELKEKELEENKISSQDREKIIMKYIDWLNEC